MKFWVGITDKEWFEFLSQLQPDELNFWQPGGGNAFRAIEPGAPFLFKLHRPDDFIVGGGFFVRHAHLPLSLAWEAFEKKNGTSDLSTLRSKITAYRHRAEIDPVIGCIVLTSPFFFQREDWIPQPEDWKPNIVQGKTYNDQEPIGMRLWAQVQERLHRNIFDKAAAVAEDSPLVGPEYLVRARLGQGSFRVLVTEAYGHRCAMTGERTLPVLQAAHIKPYGASGPNYANNGLLLRADLHLLFDQGYLTVTNELVTEVSGRIKEDYQNGKEYYALHGKKLAVIPAQVIERPSSEFIEWHNQNVFVA